MPCLRGRISVAARAALALPALLALLALIPLVVPGAAHARAQQSPPLATPAATPGDGAAPPQTTPAPASAPAPDRITFELKVPQERGGGTISGSPKKTASSRSRAPPLAI